MFPYGKLFKPDGEFKLMLLITFLVMFVISSESTHDGRGGWRFEGPRTISVHQFEPGRVSLIWNYYRNYSVTLPIINSHNVLPAGRQVVSLCLHMRSLGGSCDDGIYLCFSVVKRRRKGRREQDQYLPLQLRCTYTNIGIGMINDQNQLLTATKKGK